MNEITKTIVFALVGSTLVACAFAVHIVSKPEPNEQFALVGEEFYPEFDTADEVTFLEVAAYDVEKNEQRKFRVEFKDNLWRIPSHHDYPAESPDRLFGTAASVMGIRREALKGRRENEHERFGVIDPMSDQAAEADDPESVGVRVTLGKSDGKVLADYIVGKPVERRDMDDEMLREIRGEEEPQARHYVRRPDEKETYIATISIDASTKFSDWIEPDLLLLEANDLRQLVINDYSFEKKIEEVEVIPNSGIFQQVARSVKKDGESYKLTKESDFGSWKLEGLDEENEEIVTSKISDLTSALDNFKILGVRPRLKIDGKPILTPELVLEFPASIRTQGAAQRAIEEVAYDLESKGFNLSQNREDGTLNIASDQGELTAGTKDGVNYRLYFGKLFEGTDSEIEIGGAAASGDATKDDIAETSSSNSSSPDETAAGESGTDKSADDKSAGGDAKSDKKKSRYLLVRVEFDPQLLGDKPTPPVEPTKPEKPAAAEQDASTTPDPTTPDPTTPDPSGEDERPDAPAPPADASDDDAGTIPETDADGAECDDADDADATSAASSEPNESNSTGDSDAGAGDGSGQDDNKETTTPENGSQKPPSDDKTTDAGDPKTSGDEENAEKDDPETAYQDALSKYNQDMISYDQEKNRYEEDLKQYEDNLAKAKEKVAKLNQRFGDWFYVISVESIENLRLSRADIVRKKEKKEDDTDATTPTPLGLPELPLLPGETNEKPDEGEDKDTDASDSTGNNGSTPPPSTTESDENDGTSDATSVEEAADSGEAAKKSAEPSPASNDKADELEE